MPLFCFFFTHFEERSPMGCESFCKKEEENIWNTSFGFEVKKNCVKTSFKLIFG